MTNPTVMTPTTSGDAPDVGEVPIRSEPMTMPQTRTAQNGEEERCVGLHPHDAQAVACRSAHAMQAAGLLRALDGSLRPG